MKEIIGKVIYAVYIDKLSQQILAFETSDGNIAYIVYGDCCSESWFADITGFDCLIGSIVNEVQEISMDGYNVYDGRSRQDDDQAYGYKIRTNSGYCMIVFRNSSNGYYGGYMEKYDLEVDLYDFVQITDDWSA